MHLVFLQYTAKPYEARIELSCISHFLLQADGISYDNILLNDCKWLCEISNRVRPMPRVIGRLIFWVACGSCDLPSAKAVIVFSKHFAQSNISLNCPRWPVRLAQAAHSSSLCDFLMDNISDHYKTWQHLIYLNECKNLGRATFFYCLHIEASPAEGWVSLTTG